MKPVIISSVRNIAGQCGDLCNALQMTDQPAEHDPNLVTSSMNEPVRGPDASLNDQDDRWLKTVLASLPKRSSAAKEALLKALMDGEGSMPLLGLELANTENKQENGDLTEDSNQQAMLAPLLGTITFQSTETLGKSSVRRSPERVCYKKLLRESERRSSTKSQEIVKDKADGCYSPPPNCVCGLKTKPSEAGNGRRPPSFQ